MRNIGYGAFVECTSLREIIIPNGVTEFAPQMFNSCDNLKSVTLPNSIELIGEMAFYACQALQTVHYKGEKADWIMVAIHSGNTELNAAVISFEPEREEDDGLGDSGGSGDSGDSNDSGGSSTLLIACVVSAAAGAGVAVFVMKKKQS